MARTTPTRITTAEQLLDLLRQRQAADQAERTLRPWGPGRSAPTSFFLATVTALTDLSDYRARRLLDALVEQGSMTRTANGSRGRTIWWLARVDPPTRPDRLRDHDLERRDAPVGSGRVTPDPGKSESVDTDTEVLRLAMWRAFGRPPMMEELARFRAALTKRGPGNFRRGAMPVQSDRATLIEAFSRLTADERQLLVCALAGNHPERLAPLRSEVLRGLARADRSERANA